MSRLKEERKTKELTYYEKNKEKILKQMREQRNTPLGRAKNMVKCLKQEDRKYERGECTITPEWVVANIFTSKCIYCGESDWLKLGCDRINNDLPHTPENVVCACRRCNEKRGDIPFDKFIERLMSGEVLLKKNSPSRSKPVIALNDAGEVVYEFPSTAEAGRNGFNQRHISECCNGKLQTHGGLHWQWA